MTEATKNVFKSIFPFFAYVLIPAGLLGWYFNDPLLNGIADTGSYYIYYLFLAGMFDAMRDKCAFHYSSSIFSRFNPAFFDGSISWKNKYIDGDSTKGRKKLLGIPIPVIFTDAFHLFKSLQTLFIAISVINFVYNYHHIAIEYLVVYGSYKWGFNSFFNFILVKRNK